MGQELMIKMSKRYRELGSYIGTNCPQIQMETSTGKKRLTLAADTEGVNNTHKTYWTYRTNKTYLTHRSHKPY